MKKVMIALLSLAVVFSFAACSNENDTAVSGGLADSVYSESTVVRVAGEKISASDFEFKGLDTFKNPVALNSSDVVLVEGNTVVDSITAATTETEKAGTQTISVKTAWGATGTVTVTVLPVTKFEVSGTNAVKEYKAVVGDAATVAKEFKKIDPAGMTFKATYIDEDGNTQTKEVSPDLVKLELSQWTAGNDVKVKASYAGKDVDEAWSVKVVENKVVSLEAEVAAGYELIADNTSTLDTDKFVVYGTYENGQRAKVEAADLEYSTATEGAAADKAYDVATSIKFASTVIEGAKTVYVEYQGSLAADGNRYTNADVQVKKDYLKGLNVAVAAYTLAADYNFAPTEQDGDGYPTDKITVKAVYAGKTAPITLTAVDEWTISPLSKDGLKTGDQVAFTITPVEGEGKRGAGLAPVTFQLEVGKETTATFGEKDNTI